MSDAPNSQYRILFVCWGNICRSPTAENVMRAMITREGLSQQVRVDSAGTLNLHTGDSPDGRMVAAARARGLTMTGTARGLEQTDFEDFDLILVMDFDNRAEVMALRARHPEPVAEVRMFCEFCTRFDDQVVPDPYYGGLEGFDKVLDLIEDGCEGILAEVRELLGK